MSAYWQHLCSPAPETWPFCQKLNFSFSDEEEEPAEDASSTGRESRFTDMDSPVPPRRETADKRLDGSGSPLGDVELWAEEGVGSPAHLRPRSCSPSNPRRRSWLCRASPERPYVRDNWGGSASPIPQCPDAPRRKSSRRKIFTRRTRQRELNKAQLDRAAAEDKVLSVDRNLTLVTVH